MDWPSRMALIAYGTVVALVGLALFDRDPVAGAIAVFVGLAVAALGHTEVDVGESDNHESG